MKSATLIKLNSLAWLVLNAAFVQSGRKTINVCLGCFPNKLCQFLNMLQTRDQVMAHVRVLHDICWTIIVFKLSKCFILLNINFTTLHKTSQNFNKTLQKFSRFRLRSLPVLRKPASMMYLCQMWFFFPSMLASKNTPTGCNRMTYMLFLGIYLSSVKIK